MSMIELLSIILGGIVAYKYPLEELMKEPFWNMLQLFMALVWIFAITRPIFIILYMFGMR